MTTARATQAAALLIAGVCAGLSAHCSTSPDPAESAPARPAALSPTLTAEAKPASIPEPQDPPAAAPGGCSPNMQTVSTAGMSRAGAAPAICVDRYEVTIAEYAKCVQAAKCTEPEPYAAHFEENLYRSFCNWRHPEGHEQHPVNCLTFEQARAYCASRGARLPTDVERKWVSSNGGRTRYPWGDAAPDGKRVNGCGTECPPAIKAATGNPEMRPSYRQNDGYAATAPVASFSAGDTASGIHDLAGNVSEFVVAVESRESSGDLTAGGGCFTQNSKDMTAGHFTRTAWSAATSPTLGFRCVSE